jgi:anti-sigma factor RsiW
MKEAAREHSSYAENLESGTGPELRCEEVQQVIDAFIDGESNAVATLRIEEHTQACALCSVARRNREVLRSVIRAYARGPNAPGTHSLYHEASFDLRGRIRSALRAESRSESNHRSSRWRWIAAPVALALGAIFIFSLTRIAQHHSAEELLAQEIISSHVRSFMGNHQTDVVSSDQGIVTTWFNQRLDFAPSVENLADNEFSLQGGRIEYLRNRPVAVLVYRRQEHFINLFTWPSGNYSNATDRTMARQGYNLVCWATSGMDCWAVSDLDINELQEFARSFQEQYSSESPK